MQTKFTNTLIDQLVKNRTILKLWGAQTPISMGDGVRFRVLKSPTVDYVYIRYLSGTEQFEIEFGALVGTEYDVLDRIKPVSSENLLKTISKKIFSLRF